MPPHSLPEPAVGGAETGGVDEILLDSWIKELESGIQGMADLMGIDPEPSPPPTPKLVTTLILM